MHQTPLGQYLENADAYNWIIHSNIATGDVDQKIQIAEPHVATCMNQQGYQCLITESPHSLQTLQPTPLKHVDAYSYGITTLAFSQAQTGPGLKGCSDTPDPTSENPNISHVGQLPPHQRHEYPTALLGPEDAETAKHKSTSEIFRNKTLGTQGCRGQATRVDPKSQVSLPMIEDLGWQP